MMRVEFFAATMLPLLAFGLLIFAGAETPFGDNCRGKGGYVTKTKCSTEPILSENDLYCCSTGVHTETSGWAPWPDPFADNCKASGGTVARTKCPNITLMWIWSEWCCSPNDGIPKLPYNITPGKVFNETYCEAHPLYGFVADQKCPWYSSTLFSVGNYACCRGFTNGFPPDFDESAECQDNGGVFVPSCPKPQLSFFASDSNTCCGDQYAGNRTAFEEYASECDSKHGSIWVDAKFCYHDQLMKKTSFGFFKATCCS